MDFTAQRFKRFYIVNSNSDQGDITFRWKVLYYLFIVKYVRTSVYPIRYICKSNQLRKLFDKNYMCLISQYSICV